MRGRWWLLAVALAGCTLVVGGDPSVQTGADGDVEASPETDAIDASACDAVGCNAQKDACKKVCATAAKACNAACNKDDGSKACHAQCIDAQNACNAACVAACDECVSGCAPPCGP